MVLHLCEEWVWRDVAVDANGVLGYPVVIPCGQVLRMTDHGRAGLRAWWTDDPANPGRLTSADADVRRLVEEVSPFDAARDLGGVMSLNVHLPAAGLVLRAHQPFVSRAASW